jgi:hypothetical protein
LCGPSKHELVGTDLNLDERMGVARKAQAAQFAANVMPTIRDIQAAGHTSLNAIAGQLNARKVATANGGPWRHVQVRHFRCGTPSTEDEGSPIASYSLFWTLQL